MRLMNDGKRPCGEGEEANILTRRKFRIKGARKGYQYQEEKGKEILTYR